MTPRVLVFGGRDYADRACVWFDLDRLLAKSGAVVIITGAASGADTLAWEWAVDRDQFWVLHPADWDAHGRSAGPKRNAAMLAQWQPHRYVAFAGGNGTRDMDSRCLKAGVKHAYFGPSAT